MKKVKTKLKKRIDDSYKIFIKKGIAKEIPSFLQKGKFGKRYVIITDKVVENLFGIKLLKELRKNGIKADLISIQKGEKTKVLSMVESLAEKLVEKGIGRQDAIIALGGGVIGDLAGFLASIYMRGIPYIHIPTTLLAMVDSSIGGKTGVDLKCGKNLLGTITQPKGVFVDIQFLEKLPEKQIRSGLGEVIKYGVIKDKKFFKYLEENLDKIFERDEKTLSEIVKKSIKIKSKVIEKDERENNQRMILNYGHTYGHALEKLSNYTLLHGYAISVGMVIANEMAVKRGILKKEDADRIKQLLKSAGLPTKCLNKPTNKDLAADKKRAGDCINFVFPKKIGKAMIMKIKCQ